MCDHGKTSCSIFEQLPLVLAPGRYLFMSGWACRGKEQNYHNLSLGINLEQGV